MLAPQVIHAIDANGADGEAMALLPTLEAVFGFPGAGAFTLPLVELVADLQRSMGLLPDGIVGPKTRAKLAAQAFLAGKPLAAVWTALGAPGDFLRALPGGLELDQARPTVLAFRGSYPQARQSHRAIHAPRYDDTFAICRPDGSVEVFRGATHAYQLTSTESPGGSVGSIRPGLYRLTLQQTAPVPIFHVTLPGGSGDLPAFRDFDHDGIVSEAEAEKSVAATTGGQVKSGIGCFANSVLFHPGFTVQKPGAGRAFSSIACLTADLPDVQRLASAGRVLNLILLDAPMAEQYAGGLT